MGSTWFGWTTASVDDAIAEKMTDGRKGWFSESNCVASFTGCLEIWIYVVGSGPNGVRVQLAVNPTVDVTSARTMQVRP